MTPSQIHTFNDLLAVGGERPTAPTGLAEDLHAHILAGTAVALESWTENRLWLSKHQLFTALRCEGQLAAEASEPRTGGMHAATAIGIISHRAIQIAHTHHGRPVAEYVRYALAGAAGDEGFAEFWRTADPGTQSDLLMQMVSKVTSFLDSWPPLDESWTPRFEESIQAKVGALTLSCRADLVLGRPRPDGKQTMFLADLKSGGIHDHHVDEGRFYALVATLRHGCPPFRSTVYSLASGDFTDPDVTAEALFTVADQVIDGVQRIVAVLTDQREAELTAGEYCRWCPAKATCPAAAEAGLAPAPKPEGNLALPTIPPVPSMPHLPDASGDDYDPDGGLDPGDDGVDDSEFSAGAYLEGTPGSAVTVSGAPSSNGHATPAPAVPVEDDPYAI